MRPRDGRLPSAVQLVPRIPLRAKRIGDRSFNNVPVCGWFEAIREDGPSCGLPGVSKKTHGRLTAFLRSNVEFGSRLNLFARSRNFWFCSSYSTNQFADSSRRNFE